MAPVPESVSRSIRTSSSWRLKRLYPADSSAASRCSTVVSRIGSTEWIRNGSMIVRQRSTSPRIGAPEAAASADPVVDASAGEAMMEPLAEAVGHVPRPAGHVGTAVDDLRRHGDAVVPEGHPGPARQRAMGDTDRVGREPLAAEDA